MRRSGQQDPETARLRHGPLPFPAPAIVGGERGPVKTSLRRAKKRRGLDRTSLPAKNKTPWEGGMGALETAPPDPTRRAMRLPLVGSKISTSGWDFLTHFP